MSENKGAWIDTQTGKVVDKAPAEGVQLVAPGTESTPETDAIVERAKAIAAGEPQLETAVTSDSARGRKAK